MDFSQLLLLRVIERLMALLVGGFTIYLGFRLFLEIPQSADSSGKMALPGNISIFFSRVGPGVFFSLFGAVVVALSIYRPLDLIGNITPGRPESTAENRIEFHYANEPVVGETDAARLAALRAEAARSIAELNKFPDILPADYPKTRRIDVAQAVRASKLALLASVWGKDWGEFAKFRNWVNDGEFDPVPSGVSAEAVKIFRETRR